MKSRVLSTVQGVFLMGQLHFLFLYGLIEGKKKLLYSLMFCNWDVEIKLIKARLTGENACKLILIICAQRFDRKEVKNPGSC